MNDIDDIKPNYEQLGTYLGLQQPDIETIKMENHYIVWLCLKNVIDKWLKRNTIVSEEPNRRLLVEAIRRINPLLAIILEEKYNTWKVNLFIYVLISTIITGIFIIYISTTIIILLTLHAVTLHAKTALCGNSADSANVAIVQTLQMWQ